MQEVFNGFGCTGGNVSPQLMWKDAPAGTKSFALTLYDKDAPTGSGWWHWVAFNIPANVTMLDQGAGTAGKGTMPKGCVQSRTDFGAPGYGGPCPPPAHGPHQYVITVYALDTEKLDLDENVSPAVAGYNIRAHAMGMASLVFYYERE